MDSTAPFPFSTLDPQVGVALETFRWLLVLGFPTAVAAATIWPDFFVADEETNEKPVNAAGIYPPTLL